METKVIKITDSQRIEMIKRLMDDKRFIHQKIREGKMDEIQVERPHIKFAKPL